MTIRLAIAAAALMLAGLIGWEWRDRSADAEMATIVAQHATERQGAAERLAQFEAMAREQEHRHAADMDRIAQEYLEELSNAKAESDRVVAEIETPRLLGAGRRASRANGWRHRRTEAIPCGLGLGFPEPRSWSHAEVFGSPLAVIRTPDGALQ